jgi:hypothetical protein
VKLLPHLLLVIAIAAAIGTGISVRNTLRFLDEAETVTGTVSGFDERRDGSEVTYYAKIRFKTGSGEQIEFVSDYGSTGAQSKEVGDPVEVHYLPEDPRGARRGGFASLWLVPFLTGVSALAAGGAGYKFLTMSGSRNSRAALRAGPPSMGADPGTVAQWNLVLRTGHEKTYQAVAYGTLTMAVILLVSTSVLLLTQGLNPLIAIPAFLTVAFLLAAKKVVSDVRANTTTRAKRALRRTGHPVTARVCEVSEVKALSVTGTNPYRLIAEGVDPRGGRSRYFESDYIWSDRKPAVVDRTVEVWIDPKSSDRYWVDLETLGES